MRVTWYWKVENGISAIQETYFRYANKTEIVLQEEQ